MLNKECPLAILLQSTRVSWKYVPENFVKNKIRVSSTVYKENSGKLSREKYKNKFSLFLG
jgi:hypothetical protein